MDMDSLTPAEILVLEQLIKSSASNGHDFGFTDDPGNDLSKSGAMNKHAAAALVGSLQKKGWITVYHDGYEQFVFTDEARTALGL